MNRYEVQGSNGPAASLHQTQCDPPRPGHGEVLIAVKAVSLNFRDLIITQGGYPRNEMNPVVPASDAAGEITELGPGVEDWNVGDRVMPNFLRHGIAGDIGEKALASGLGGGVDGVLAEYIVAPAEAIVKIPDYLTDIQAATLPCAALTAYHALTAAHVNAGDTVLLLGTGGVSIFGLQLAKALGAQTCITSSSDEKLNRAQTLGADHTVNYQQHPQWHEPVRAWTQGQGVDCVLEVGGDGTLEQSLKATRVGGTISLIGLLAQADPPSLLPALLNRLTVKGIYVGNVAMFQRMLRIFETHQIQPVIDRTFAFDNTVEAYTYFASQQHVGKVVITL